MPNTFSVSTAAQLQAAIVAANAGAAAATSPANTYTITLTGNITETANLTALDMVNGSTLTIDGGNFLLDGTTAYSGLVVTTGSVNLQNLTIENTKVIGGSGGGGGGGGAGLGGGLFVNNTATVTASAVTFTNDAAVGGSGGSGGFGGGGGGGGSGNFHIGGGPGGPGGFGGGLGGLGGLAGYFGGNGGGGLGAGGDIFVQQGGSLVIESGSLDAGSAVTGGVGANFGSAFGQDIFLQGNQTLTLAPDTGHSVTISGVIADQTGSGGTGGAGDLIVNGPGTVTLSGTNTFTGNTTLDAGTLLLSAQGAGSGNIIFGANADAVLGFAASGTPSNSINGFAAGDTILVTGLAFAQGASITASGNLATLHVGSQTATFTVAGASSDTFTLAAGANAGTAITLSTLPLVTEVLAYDTGTSPSDDLTSDPELSGAGDANAVVTITEGTTVLGTTMASTTGAWTFTPTLSDGSHTLVASETNSSGTGTASLTFTLDTVAPVVTETLTNDTGSSSTDHITNNPALSGTGDANASVLFTDFRLPTSDGG